MSTQTERKTHREAINDLGFVYRRLPTGHPRNGKHFVPADEFDAKIPNLLVIIEDTDTYLHSWQGTEGYVVTFRSTTPANVVNQALAAAMQERS